MKKTKTTLSKLTKKIFNVGRYRHKFYHVVRDEGYREDVFTLYFAQNYRDKEKIPKNPYADIEIIFTSMRLAKKVRKEFLLFKGWHLESHCHDGGDDWALTKRKTGSWKEIEKYLKKLKSEVPKLFKFEKKSNLCYTCDRIYGGYIIKDFKNIQVCGDCRDKIVSENIQKYMGI